MNYFKEGVLFQLGQIWQVFSVGLKGVYDIFNIPLSKLLRLNVPVIDDVILAVLNFLKIDEMTIITFMFGSGLIIFVTLIILYFFASITDFE